MVLLKHSSPDSPWYKEVHWPKMDKTLRFALVYINMVSVVFHCYLTESQNNEQVQFNPTIFKLLRKTKRGSN